MQYIALMYAAQELYSHVSLLESSGRLSEIKTAICMICFNYYKILAPMVLNLFIGGAGAGALAVAVAVAGAGTQTSNKKMKSLYSRLV